jgi:uncharacterized protein (TIGR02444 family)
MQDNPFWQYSLRSYQLPGVKPLLLALQDEAGADVNVLLCCCWLGQQGVSLSMSTLADLQQATAGWRAECIVPLRAVRRYLKSQPDQAAFRQQVQALELAAEKHQQDWMYRLLTPVEAIDSADVSATMLANLQGYLLRIPALEWQTVADNVLTLVGAIAPSRSGAS